METPASASVPIPGRESELKDRLLECIGEESKNSFARRADLPESLLRKYLGGAMPSTDRLVRMASAGGVTIEWLATGRGPRTPGRREAAAAPTVVMDDLARLQGAVEAVEEGLRAIGRTLPPAKYAQLVAAAYELMAAPATSTAQIVKFIKAAT